MQYGSCKAGLVVAGGKVVQLGRDIHSMCEKQMELWMPPAKRRVSLQLCKFWPSELQDRVTQACLAYFCCKVRFAPQHGISFSSSAHANPPTPSPGRWRCWAPALRRRQGAGVLWWTALPAAPLSRCCWWACWTLRRRLRGCRTSKRAPPPPQSAPHVALMASGHESCWMPLHEAVCPQDKQARLKNEHARPHHGLNVLCRPPVGIAGHCQDDACEAVYVLPCAGGYVALQPIICIRM